ncbi:MAG: sugar transferase, partial [Ruminococcaceae bacterium]|nr:sugar transferase [Oscillospiraceae bacterium]
MKNKEQFKRLFRLFLASILVLFQTSMYAYMWISYYNENIPRPLFQKGNWLLYVLYMVIFVTFLHSFDGVKYGRYRKSNLIISQTLATIFTLGVSYMQIVLLSLRFVNVIPMMFLLAADIVFIFLLTILGDYLFCKVFPAKKVLIVYDKYSPDTFVHKLTTRKDKFVLKEIVNVSEGLEKLEEKIKASEGVILYDISAEMRNKLLKICFEDDIRAYATTKISDILVRGAECIHLFDTPLLLYRNNGMTIEQRIVKRAMDIVISLIMLVLSSPILLVSAIAIKLYDGGPVFFRQ